MNAIEERVQAGIKLGQLMPKAKIDIIQGKAIFLVTYRDFQIFYSHTTPIGYRTYKGVWHFVAEYETAIIKKHIGIVKNTIGQESANESLDESRPVFDIQIQCVLDRVKARQLYHGD